MSPVPDAPRPHDPAASVNACREALDGLVEAAAALKEALALIEQERIGAPPARGDRSPWAPLLEGAFEAWSATLTEADAAALALDASGLGPDSGAWRTALVKDLDAYRESIRPYFVALYADGDRRSPIRGDFDGLTAAVLGRARELAPLRGGGGAVLNPAPAVAAVAPDAALPALTPKQLKTLDFIKANAPIHGREIAAAVVVNFEHFLKWVGDRGALKAHGVRNDRDHRGYYWAPPDPTEGARRGIPYH